MGNLIITAKAAAFSSYPPAITTFRDEDRRHFVAMPEFADVDGEQVVKWAVPDTPANRSQFRQYYAGELYSCESIDLETPVPFKSGAGANAVKDTTVSYSGPPKAGAGKATAAKAKK
jgi:hypothetical protein